MSFLWVLCVISGWHPGFAFGEVTEGPPRIRNVYVPSDQLKVLFESSSKGVLMPREKVLALWNEGRRGAAREEVPPADAVLSAAAYEAGLADHELRMSGRIEIAKLRGGWQAVDLPFGRLAIESARVDGQPARFGRRDDGTLFLLLNREGRVTLELEMSAPLSSKGGDLATTLKLPPVPASEVLVRLERGKQLQVGETILVPERGESDEQVFRVAVDRSGLVPLLVSDRSAGVNRAPLVFARSLAVGHVEPAGLRWQVSLGLDVYARATDSFELELPDSVDVAEVEAPQLAAWSIDDRSDETAVVTLTFRKPFLGRRAVRFIGLAPVPLSTEWNVPTVKVLGVASHVGEVVVNRAASLRVEVGPLRGIRPERLSVPGKDDPPMAFAFWDEDFRLPLSVVPRRGRLQASVASLVEVSRSGLELRSNVTVESRYAPVFDLSMQLSGGWEVTSVLSGGKRVEWELVEPVGEGAADNVVGDAADDALAGPGPRVVRFELVKPLRPGESLEVAISAGRHPEAWLEQDERYDELPLPELRLVGADEVEGTVLVEAPADIDLAVLDLSDDLQPVAADRSSGGSSGGTALQYHYQDDARVWGRLQVRTKPAKVSAETLAFARLDRGKLDVHYQVALSIRHGKIRQIRFVLPEAVGEKVRIVPIGSSVRVIEQRHTRLAEGPNQGAASTLWEVVLDQPVTGELMLAVDFGQTFPGQARSTGTADARGGDSVPGETGGGDSGGRVEIPVLALENVSQQSGIVAIEAASDQEITCEPENLRDLDPADVVMPRVYVPSQRIVAAYQYQRLPYGLSISATRHASGSVLGAICESAAIVSVVGREGRVRHQARFRLRSLNLQHLPVTLPETADLWSVMLGGEPIEVRKKQGRYIVPLPAGETVSSDDARDLTLLYETESPRLAGQGSWRRFWPRTIRQTAPKIEMTTLSTSWYVYLPDGTEWVSTGGDFRPERPPSRTALVTRLADGIGERSRSLIGAKVFGLVAAFLVAGLLMAKTSGKSCGVSLVELLVVAAIIVMLIGLLLPATQAARESARRAQCMNNLKQIGLGLQNYHEVYGEFPPAAIGPHNVPRDRQFSWLVAILPFIEQGTLYDRLRLDLPWDHPHNAAYLQIDPRMLTCPSNATTTTRDGYTKTSYVAITGADLTYGSGSTHGIFGFERGLAIKEVFDGTSDTLMVAEVIDGGPWFAAGSGTARRIDDWIGKQTWSYHPGGANFLFADGRVKFVSSSVTPQTLRSLATAQGREKIDEADYSASFGVSDRDVSDDEEGGLPMILDSTDSTDSAFEGEPTAAPESASEPSAPEPSAPEEMGVSEDMDEAAEGMDRKGADKEGEVADGKDRVAGVEEEGVEEPPGEVVVPFPAGKGKAAGERGRLSLRVGIETHQGRAILFLRDGGPGELVFRLQDRTFACSLKWFLVAASFLAAWIFRRAPGPRRAIAVIMGLAAPIGLSGLAPLASAPVLDGLLLGTLAGVGLWFFLGIVGSIRARVSASKAGGAVVGICLLLATSASVAEEGGRSTERQAGTGQVGRPNLTLYIPYDDEDVDPFENTRVYLPHDEFLRLWKAAHREEPKDAVLDVRAIVGHAEYSGRLEKGVARFDGRLLVDHFDDRWVRVLLPLGKVALEKLEIDGEPATLADPSEGQAKANPAAAKGVGARQAVLPHRASEVGPAIFLEEAGQHVVDVRFSVPVSRLGETGHVIVPLKGVPSGRLLFRLPGEDLDVQVGGCSGGWRRQGAVGEDTAGKKAGELVHIPLGAAGELSIRWQPRRAEARAGQLTSVDQGVLVEVLDSGIHLTSKLHYRIQQGSLHEVRLRIPADMAVQHVEGAEVADWSIETDPGDAPNGKAQRVVVSLKTELRTGTDLTMRCFRRDRQLTGTLAIHVPEPLGVVRETGRIAIGCSSHLRVRVGQTERVDQINQAGLEVPQSRNGGCVLMSAYRYTSRPWRLELEVERHRPRVEVTDRTAVVVAKRQALLRSLITADVTGARVGSFRLRLPASFRVSQVRVPPGADWFVDREEGVQRLKVELAEPVLGQLNLAVSGSLVRDSDSSEFVVPGVVVEGVQAQRGELAITLDDDLEAILADSGGARPIDPAELHAVLQPKVGRRVHYAFRVDSPPENLRLRLSRAFSRLNADVTTVVSVREGTVAYASKVDFEIRRAGVSRFRVQTPKWLGDDIELEGEQVRQIRSHAADGGRIWEIELQQPARGTYRVQLMQTLALPDDGTVAAAVIRPLDVERSRSHLVLENLTGDEIAATTTRGVAAISIGAVPEGLTETLRRQAVAAYRVSGDPAASLAWQRHVREQETGLQASINLADLTTVVHADGRYRGRAAYSIRNFTLQFLELELPPKSRVWSVHVSGQPVRPAKIDRQGRPVTLLPLQKTSAGDFSSKVVVIYSGHLGKPLGIWTRLEPLAPRVLSDVPVSRTLWTLLPPREYKVSFVKRLSNMEEVGASYQQQERKLSFLDELREMVQVASQSGKSGAREKARQNLKEVGTALGEYGDQSSKADAINAADVQVQAQQIEAEIRRLEERGPETRRAGDDANSYFLPPQPEAGLRAAPVDWGFDELSIGPAATDTEVPTQDAPKQQEPASEQQRGRLRAQAIENLEKLQTTQQADQVEIGGAAAAGLSKKKPKGQRAAGVEAARPGVDGPTSGESDRSTGRAEGDRAGQAAVPEVSRSGYLSLDLDLPFEGTAYHFRKLHGEPRLVLRARHENLGRLGQAIVWAVLCLGMAVGGVLGVRQADGLAVAARCWPWFAAVAGATWLFLLPYGVLGFVLLVTGLCVLISRHGEPLATGSSKRSATGAV